MRRNWAPLLLLCFSLSTQAAAPAQGLAIWGKLLGTNPVVEGPNCWNLAIVDLGITAHKRFTGAEEFRETMTAYCLPVPASRIGKGDIGAITYYEDAYELHAFVVVDSVTALTKDFGSDDPLQNISYRVEPIKTTIAPYIKSMNSPECQGALKYAEQSPCGARLQYYRCDRSKIFASHVLLENLFPRIAKSLKQSEESLENYHWNKASQDQVLLSLTELDQALESTDFKSLREYSELRKLLRIRILGMKEGVLTVLPNAPGARLQERLGQYSEQL